MPLSSRFAYITLVTNDTYVEPAITLAHSLKTIHASPYDLIVLISSSQTISPLPLARLHRAFHKVIQVPLLKSGSHKNDSHNLTVLLNRPELDITYTKIHVFNPDIVSGYDQIAFLDADTIVLRNVDRDFFGTEGKGGVLEDADFAAAPDVGWPDVFNSGVFVARPRREVYEGLLWEAENGGSFDGGDQGLLNSFFSSWATGRYDRGGEGEGVEGRPVVAAGIKRTARLPFIFNVTPSAVYSYAPAFQHFKDKIAIIHFAGHTKPWTQIRFSSDGSVWNSSLSKDAADLYGIWWNVHDDLIRLWNAEDKLKIPLYQPPAHEQNSEQPPSNLNNQQNNQQHHPKSLQSQYAWNTSELPFKKQQQLHPTDFEWSKKKEGAAISELESNNNNKVVTQTKRVVSSSTTTSPTSSSSTATITKVITTTITTTTTTTTTVTGSATASGNEFDLIQNIPTSRTGSSRGRRSTTTTITSSNPSSQSMKIFQVVTSPTQQTYVDPRLQSPTATTNSRSNSVSSQRNATASSYSNSTTPSHSNATSPTRYEWNADEFTKAQRKRSQANLPVFVPAVAPSLGSSRSPSVNAAAIAGPSSASPSAPVPPAVPKKESTESLFDEEGYSLHPAKKE
ncbi:UNVERIFIED_CONTAM: hypothetical protein HDU68_012111 [Siphonaria sp. JEL0065]|nr:hypothetical protein HDU68_012111 [Siphonaria sp. JEL0065]